MNDRDPVGFADLYERSADRLYAAAFRYVGERTAAEDAVQQAFLELFRSTFRAEKLAALEAWLFTSVRYACLKEHRRRRRRPEVPTDDIPAVAWYDATDDGFDPEFEEALGQLSPDQRLVLHLKHVEGLDGAEIARIVCSNRAAVYARAARAEARLRALLRPVESPGAPGSFPLEGDGGISH